MPTIYHITGYGDEGYYRDLAVAEREIRACGGDHTSTVLQQRGMRIYDDTGACVGDVIDEALVPLRDRWQLAGDVPS